MILAQKTYRSVSWIVLIFPCLPVEKLLGAHWKDGGRTSNWVTAASSSKYRCIYGSLSSLCLWKLWSLIAVNTSCALQVYTTLATSNGKGSVLLHLSCSRKYGTLFSLCPFNPRLWAKTEKHISALQLRSGLYYGRRTRRNSRSMPVRMYVLKRRMYKNWKWGHR